MEAQEALRLLEYHNKWRRGADIPMLNPTILGLAIEKVVDTYIDHSLDGEYEDYIQKLYYNNDERRY